MSKEVVQLRTIEQWNAIDAATQKLVLSNLKIKDRLQRFVLSQQKKELKALEAPKWVPCKKCDTRGWLLKEPRYPGIHPSQINHSCLLKIYKEMLGDSGISSFDPKTLLIFQLGKYIHDMLQDYGEAGAWGPNYTKEIKINSDLYPLAHQLMIEGHADADNLLILDDIPNSPTFEVGLVHEYKSMNTNLLSKLTRPKPEHTQQAILYSAVLNRPIVVYLYFNKNESTMLDFPIPFEPHKWNSIKEKCETLVTHYNNNHYPEGTAGYHCNQCSFVFECSHAKKFSSKK